MFKTTTEQLATLLSEEASHRRLSARKTGDTRLMKHNLDRADELSDLAGQLRQSSDAPDLNDALEAFVDLTYYVDQLLNANTLAMQAIAVDHVSNRLSDAKTWLPSVWNDRGEWVQDEA